MTDETRGRCSKKERWHGVPRQRRAPIASSVPATVVILLLALLLAVLSGCAVSPQTSGDSPAPSTLPSASTPQRSVTTSSTTPPTTMPPPTPTSLPKAAVIARLQPSVVGVTALLTRSATRVLQAVGTGVVYRRDGLIITNNHVITGDGARASTEITVRLSTGRRLRATLVGRDAGSDLAVLRVASRRLTPARFRTDLRDLSPGDPVVALGNPRFLKHPVTSGTVIQFLTDVSLSQAPELQRLILADAPIAQGNSGGPLVDAQARVIGINMGIPLDRGVAERGEVSIPADLVVQTIERLIRAAK